MVKKQEVVRFLQKNGVETRFVSIIDEKIYINNLKLSRFSRKREEIFLEHFPNFEVKRSKMFQKICTRASRVLKNALKPHDKIIVANPSNCVNRTLYAVLEPYTRKYGVELVMVPEFNFKEREEFKLPEKQELNVDAVALPLTLDGEVEHIIGTILDGENLDLVSLHTCSDGVKMVYPLINVPRSWIKSWVEIEGLNCVFEEEAGLPGEVLEFLEGFIPDVREKMMRSALYLSQDE
jgi:hypothetical protein